jgi:hypothetical protein
MRSFLPSLICALTAAVGRNNCAGTPCQDQTRGTHRSSRNGSQAPRQPPSLGRMAAQPRSAGETGQSARPSPRLAGPGRRPATPAGWQRAPGPCGSCLPLPDPKPGAAKAGPPSSDTPLLPGPMQAPLDACHHLLWGRAQPWLQPCAVSATPPPSKHRSRKLQAFRAAENSQNA